MKTIKEMYETQPKDYSGKIHRWQTIFCGNKIFLEQLSKIISKNTDITIKGISKEKNISLYCLCYYTYDSIKLGKWMYKDSTIHLDRKYKKF